MYRGVYLSATGNRMWHWTNIGLIQRVIPSLIIIMITFPTQQKSLTWVAGTFFHLKLLAFQHFSISLSSFSQSSCSWVNMSVLIIYLDDVYPAFLTQFFLAASKNTITNSKFFNKTRADFQPTNNHPINDNTMVFSVKKYHNEGINPNACWYCGSVASPEMGKLNRLGEDVPQMWHQDKNDLSC